DLAGAVLAYRFEHADHGQVFAVQVSGFDGPTVHKDGGDIQTGDGDQRARHVLVAAAHRQQAVQALAAAHRLDGIGDHLARDQAVAHALRSHGDAIAYSDGPEDLRHGAGVVQSIAGAQRQVVKAQVAWCNGAVGVGYANNRLLEVGVGKAYGA